MNERARVGVTGVVAIVAAVQLLAAAGASVWRRGTEAELERQRLRTGELHQQAQRDAARATEAGATAVAAWQLDPIADVAGTMQRLQGLGDRLDVHVATLQAPLTKQRDQQQFQITGTATPTQLAALLAAIENEPRLLVVERGRIGGASADLLGFDLVVTTWHAGSRP